METENQIKFVQKYAPQKIADMVLTADLKEFFQNMVNTKKFQNFSLIAGPGIGKTTLAKTLAKEANAEVLFMACAAGDGKVESIQTKLIPFVQSMPIDDKPMFVIFDEIDSASSSQESSFQKALRNVIEKYPNVVYIATANYKQKIIAPLLSRCRQIDLEFTLKDVLLRLKDILDAEKISYTKTSLKKFVEQAMAIYYPDIRQIVDYLQSCCATGELVPNEAFAGKTSSARFLDEIVDMVLDNKADLLKIREFYLGKKSEIPDYAILASDLFRKILDEKLVVIDKSIIIKLADIVYQINMAVDKEVSFFQFLTVMSMLDRA